MVLCRYFNSSERPLPGGTEPPNLHCQFFLKAESDNKILFLTGAESAHLFIVYTSLLLIGLVNYFVHFNELQVPIISNL